MTGQQTNILIVDDHPIVLDSLARRLKEEPDFQVVGTAGDGKNAIEMIASLKPDIVIMDNEMPNLDGLEAAKEIRERFPETKIVIYSMFSDKALVAALFKQGISGYVLKGVPMNELIMALNSVASGGTFYSQDVTMNLQEYLLEDHQDDEAGDALNVLSEREKELFLLLADGVPTEKIARRLYISPKTVDSHKYNIMYKLNLTSMAQLTKLAVREKLIKI